MLRCFFERDGDCYDGLHLPSGDVVDFALHLIQTQQVDEFIKKPDILKFTKRAVSCGNSSCLYLLCGCLLENIDESLYSIDFLNQVCDIIYPDLDSD